MVFVGNINQSMDTMVKTSHLLASFPDVMIDSAFFDRFHTYIPGWEIPKTTANELQAEGESKTYYPQQSQSC